MRRKLPLVLSGALATGLVLTATPGAQAVPTADSVITAHGGYSIIAGREDGVAIEIRDGTTFRMTCWYDGNPLQGEFSRMFFGEFTSGRYDGTRGKVAAVYVLKQTTVPRC